MAVREEIMPAQPNLQPTSWEQVPSGWWTIFSQVTFLMVSMISDDISYALNMGFGPPNLSIVLDIFSYHNIVCIHTITKQRNVQINSSLQPARAPPEETSPSWDRSHPTHIFPCLIKDVALTLTIRDGERNSDFFHDTIKVTQCILILFPDHLCLLPSAAWTPQWHDHLRFVFL